uniref:Uncharacterized protein n=1 Tax=Human betaherpesvirus 6A TaxID=32603 RepID=A0A2L2Q8N8_9BETA|nr:hypothetical protein [Human betaherpesvirus 6A]AVI07655.1 hypothetical protein [Human betaherpesvirus 6A]AVI07776.1 hypothetical protein [Human betaherpesvirus 6A]AVI07897.1 hypothetical protein [Human betaherpesvirus 6A]AVI08274.1 hypothetical protein [Human betaherpesvirus 6A]
MCKQRISAKKEVVVMSLYSIICADGRYFFIGYQHSRRCLNLHLNIQWSQQNPLETTWDPMMNVCKSKYD